MEHAARDPNLLATDLAEYLVRKNLPFREARETVGKIVARASEMKVAIDNLSNFQMQEISPLFGEDLAIIFNARRSLALRRAIGAPSPENIKAQMERWQGILRNR